MADLWQVLDKLKEKYPHLEKKLDILQHEVKAMEENAASCKYEDIMHSLWWFTAFTRETLPEITHEEAMEIFDAEKELYKKIAETLKTQCGCK